MTESPWESRWSWFLDNLGSRMQSVMTDISPKCSEEPERTGCGWLNPELLGGRECGSAPTEWHWSLEARLYIISIWFPFFRPFLFTWLVKWPLLCQMTKSLSIFFWFESIWIYVAHVSLELRNPICPCLPPPGLGACASIRGNIWFLYGLPTIPHWYGTIE